MLSNELDSIALRIDRVREKRPLVHCITNYVTVNDCANAILAAGGSPVMADDFSEVTDIVSLANALVINIGTLDARTIRSMFRAGKAAAKLGKPIVLDPVGAGASAFRTATARKLLRDIPFTVIKGNSSEIAALIEGKGNTRGVDAAEESDKEGSAARADAAAKALSLKTDAIVVSTGAIDTVADGHRVFRIKNGDEMMARITGSGCMLGALLGAYCGSMTKDAFLESVAAVTSMGIAGERAARSVRARDGGTGMFRSALIDELSNMNGRTTIGDMRIETD